MGDLTCMKAVKRARYLVSKEVNKQAGNATAEASNLGESTPASQHSPNL